MSAEERPVVALGDVLSRVNRPVELQADSPYRSIGVRLRAAGLFIKEERLGSQISAKKLNRVERGDVVYSRLFAWRGAFGIAHPEHDGCVASNEFPTYRASERLLPEFFEIWASQSSVWDEAEVFATGTTAASRNRLSEDDFLDFELELPSLAEQFEIVRAVRRVDVSIARQRRLVKALRDLLRATQFALFESLEDEEMEIGEVAQVRTGGTPSRDTPSFFGGDVPWAKTGDIKFRDLSETSETITEEGVKRSNAKVFPAGTVVLAMIGQGATRGRAAILGKEMATNQNSAAILPCEAIDPRFLLHWFWFSYEELRSGAEGTSYPALNKGLVEEMAFPFPPVERQEEIGRQLHTIAESLFAAEDALTEKERLRPALVAELLAGDKAVIATGTEHGPQS